MSQLVTLTKPLAARWELVVVSGAKCGDDPIYYCGRGIGWCRAHNRMISLRGELSVLAQPVDEPGGKAPT
jgi:hypothetical protein